MQWSTSECSFSTTAISLLYCNISTVISPQGAETFRRKKSRCAKNSGWRKRHRGSWSVQSCSHHKITKYQWNWSPKIFKAENIKTTKTNQTNKQLDPPPPLRRSWQKFPDRRPLWRWIRDAYRAKLPQVATGKVATGNTTAPCKLATGKVANFKSSISWTFLIKSLICNCLMIW